MITKDNFIITRTERGKYTVRWKHNNRALETYREKKKANSFIRWLVNYLNKSGWALGFTEA